MNQSSAPLCDTHRPGINGLRWIRMTMVIGIATFAVIGHSVQSKAFEVKRSSPVGEVVDVRPAPERNAALRRAYGPTGTFDFSTPGQYGALSWKARAAGLEVRGAAAMMPAGPGRSPRCDIALAYLCRGWLHLFPEEAKPLDNANMAAKKEALNNGPAVTTLSLQEKFRVYLVRPGDSLWNIARQFHMDYRTLAKINGVKSGKILQVGQPLKVHASASSEMQLDLTAGALATHPSLPQHIRMIDGRTVPRWLVTDYVADVIDKRSPGAVRTGPGSRTKNLTIVIHFQLVKNLLEGRARRYQAMVRNHARKYNIDPALIMAMIHTESRFNPKARSNASAYGLMQLVAQTAGREAYHQIYGRRRELTPEYLQDPGNNIELGTAYLHILSSRYLGSIADPLSRTYCVVAAYHAGPSIVERVFTPGTSIRQAASIINRLKPAEVYQRLVEKLPSVESRNYLRNVVKRVSRYSHWYSKESNTQASKNLGRASI